MSVILHSAIEETASGVGSSMNTSNILIGMFVNISSSSGVLPTLVVKLQHSPNGNDWYDVPGVTTASLAGISLTGILPSTQQYIADNIRAVWTIGGVNAQFVFEVEVATVGG